MSAPLALLLSGGRWLWASAFALTPQRAATLGGGALVLLLALWIWSLRAGLAEAEARAAALDRALTASRAESAARGRALAALEALYHADDRRDRLLEEATEEAINADPSENGGLAPVLQRALERLRRGAGPNPAPR